MRRFRYVHVLYGAVCSFKFVFVRVTIAENSKLKKRDKQGAYRGEPNNEKKIFNLSIEIADVNDHKPVNWKNERFHRHFRLIESYSKIYRSTFKASIVFVYFFFCLFAIFSFRSSISLSLSLPLFLSFSLSHSLSLYLSFSLSHTHSHSFSFSLIYTRISAAAPLAPSSSRFRDTLTVPTSFSESSKCIKNSKFRGKRSFPKSVCVNVLFSFSFFSIRTMSLFYNNH